MDSQIISLTEKELRALQDEVNTELAQHIIAVRGSNGAENKELLRPIFLDAVGGQAVTSDKVRQRDLALTTALIAQLYRFRQFQERATREINELKRQVEDLIGIVSEPIELDEGEEVVIVPKNVTDLSLGNEDVEDSGLVVAVPSVPAVPAVPSKTTPKKQATAEKKADKKSANSKSAK